MTAATPPSDTESPPKSSPSVASQRSWFRLPEPIRLLFNTFPLVTYDANPLPQRAPRQRGAHSLYLFTSSTDGPGTTLSSNPACLKWQAYLLFNNITFSIVPSNNHSSPSGSLPFLLPAPQYENALSQAITANKISKWVRPHDADSEMNTKLEIYIALIDQNIRNAWLYHLYLSKDNFQAVAVPLYIQPASANAMVRFALEKQLQAAARAQILQSYDFIDEGEIYEVADSAFRSLSLVLGQQNYFGGTDKPGLFDAMLFAYTQPLLEFCQDNRAGAHMSWIETTLVKIVQKYSNLLEHRTRLRNFCQQA